VPGNARLPKNIYKIGIAEGDPKPLAATGWAGESDWIITRKQTVEGLSEDDALEKLARKEKMAEPHLYPKLKGVSVVSHK
jgi:hypothetical protein